MADDDFNDIAARHRAKQLWAQRQQAAAHLAAAEANNDLDYAGELIEEIAAIDAKGESLNRLHQSYVSQRNPPPPPQQTDGEFMAKAPERMSYADVQRMTARSKYGAVSAEDMQRGINELQRRKAGGAYKD
jgi:hypothetical protein